MDQQVNLERSAATAEEQSSTSCEFLVCHDYGTGGLWWRIIAPSAEHILEALAEVSVHAQRPDFITEDVYQSLGVLDLSEIGDDPVLVTFRDKRTAQRSAPSYGGLRDQADFSCRLPGRAPVVDSYQEIRAGELNRIVQRYEDGRLSRYDVPKRYRFVDVRDPKYSLHQITDHEFETLWNAAGGE